MKLCLEYKTVKNNLELIECSVCVSLYTVFQVRCDSGIQEGSEISIYYDAMICKVWALTTLPTYKLNDLPKTSYAA